MTNAYREIYDERITGCYFTNINVMFLFISVYILTVWSVVDMFGCRAGFYYQTVHVSTLDRAWNVLSLLESSAFIVSSHLLT